MHRGIQRTYVRAEQAKVSTLIRRHGNQRQSGMNARCKDPPHSILGSHERALHMLLLHVRCTEHAILMSPPPLSCAIDLLVWPALLPCSLGQTRISMSMCDTICVLRAIRPRLVNVYHKFTTYHIQLFLRNAGRHLVVCCHNTVLSPFEIISDFDFSSAYIYLDT